MSSLDKPNAASVANNVFNTHPGDTKVDRVSSNTGTIAKGEFDHDDDPEKRPEERDINTKADHFGTNTVYSAAETKLVRKLDWHIMPIVFCMYFMNKLDQNAIANARLDSFEKDLGLVGNQFNVCVSVLYAGYTLIQASLVITSP
jgi:hypothetical protein